MKALFLLMLGLFPALLSAQYTGGNGGGYSSTSLLLNPELPFAVQTGPNPVLVEDLLQVRVTDVRSKVSWHLYAVDGRLLGKEYIWTGGSIWEGQITMPKVAGTYILALSVDGRLARLKILVQAP